MQRNFFHQNNSVENIKLTVEEKNIQTDSQLIYGLKSSSVLTFVTRKCRIASQYSKIRKINTIFTLPKDSFLKIVITSRLFLDLLNVKRLFVTRNPLLARNPLLKCGDDF